jgi:hypothetical protein
MGVGRPSIYAPKKVYGKNPTTLLHNIEIEKRDDLSVISTQ